LNTAAAAACLSAAGVTQHHRSQHFMGAAGQAAQCRDAIRAIARLTENRAGQSYCRVGGKNKKIFRTSKFAPRHIRLVFRNPPYEVRSRLAVKSNLVNVHRVAAKIHTDLAQQLGAARRC
jgi:hypothetical protein